MKTSQKILGLTRSTAFTVAFALSCIGALSDAEAGRVINLRPGDNPVQVSQLQWDDVVTCGNGPITPPGPPPPVRQCEIDSAARSLSRIRDNISRMSNYECSRPDVGHCGGTLEQHAVGNSQRGLYNDLNQVSDLIERECDGASGCSRRNVEQALDDLEDTIRLAERTPLRYRGEGGNPDSTADMLTSTAGLFPRCGGGFRRH